MLKKYKIIYADPPWEYRVWSKKEAGRTASSHYDVMNITDIKKLPVYKIADEDSVLFLWTTWPNLLDAIEVINSWGFGYKTVAFVWVKNNKNGKGFFTGMGYYTRANSEICLLATRGKTLKRMSKSVHQIVNTSIEKHSKKPDIVRDRIVELFGDLPRIELFARYKYDGWDAWGFEIDGIDIRDKLNGY